jgi:hypothetical protein
MAHDDIKDSNLTHLEEIPIKDSVLPQSPLHKEIGPESEVRGGPEAPED